MRKLFSLLLVCVLSSGLLVKADEFNNNTTMSSYSGGYINGTLSTSEGYHWTYYGQREGTVGAGIKVLNYNTEVATGTRTARIQSKYLASPYAKHTHYKYVY